MLIFTTYFLKRSKPLADHFSDDGDGRDVGVVVEELSDGPLLRRRRAHVAARPVRHRRGRVLAADALKKKRFFIFFG
jgi:hypothetical protein